jgi:hypothetical protein
VKWSSLVGKVPSDPKRAPGPAGGAQLIDRFVPEWEWDECHEMVMAAGVEKVYAAALDTDLRRSWVTDTLIKMRRLPGRARTIREIADRGFIGFIPLAEAPNEEIVFGLVGRFWRKTGSIVQVPPRRFTAFNTRGYVKLAWNFRFQPVDATHTRVTTETRILATSPYARRRFRAYWFVVRPFSGRIRREMLKAIRRAAEGKGARKKTRIRLK